MCLCVCMYVYMYYLTVQTKYEQKTDFCRKASITAQLWGTYWDDGLTSIIKWEGRGREYTHNTGSLQINLIRDYYKPVIVPAMQTIPLSSK